MREDYNIMLAGSFDELAGQVIRIGHMGSNANLDDMKETMDALNETLIKTWCGFKWATLEKYLKQIFNLI